VALRFDPIEEARRQWSLRWDDRFRDTMAAATSIMRAQQVVLATVDEALRPYDLTFARYEALMLLSFTRTGALPLGKMSQRLMIHQASVTNIVNRLEGQGLVRRVPHPTDGRTTLAELTEDGRRRATEATEAVRRSEFGLGALGEKELEALVGVVRHLRSAAGDFAD
jgi:DNA-binding MarR family transcriptional regulator